MPRVSRRERPGVHLEVGARLHPEPLGSCTRRLRPRDGSASCWAPPLQAAKRFPQTKFATIDYRLRRRRAPKNLRGLLFAEQESGYLAGARRGVRLEDPVSASSAAKHSRRWSSSARATSRREGDQAGHQGPVGLLGVVHRSGQVQGDGPEPVRRPPRTSFSRRPACCGVGALQAAKEKGSGASAWTATRRSWARTSSRARSSASTSRSSDHPRRQGRASSRPATRCSTSRTAA